MAAAAPTKIGTGAGKSAVESKGVVLKQPANEVVFAVVGHIGSGTSEIAKALKGLLSAATGGSFDVEILKARDAIRAWAVSQGLQTPKTGDDDLATVEALQDLGDKMRFDTKDNAAVAKALILEIRQTRARKTGVGDPGENPVRPDGCNRAYVLDSFAPEIFAHAQRIGKFFNLYEVACFQTRVTELRWDESIKRWIVRTNRDDAMKARFVVTASGPASRPKLPGIPGLDEFEGHSFHTSRWDYAYTGGDNSGNLDKLADKRVAIIGTGASAIQCVPHVGAAAKQLYVFQRTPSSVDLRGNKPTDPEWVKSLKPGWQRERQQNFDDIIMGRPFEVDLVNDAWTDIFRNLQSLFPFGPKSDVSPEETARRAEIADFKKMNQVRARVDEAVQDDRIAEALKPWYRQFCKRPTFNDEYLPTFNRVNVTLVDTSECHGVERITKRGVVANGVEYGADLIIFATGFEISTPFKRRIGFGIYGRNGQSLYDHWAKGMRTLHGHSTYGFPNWFFVGASQNGVSVNFGGMVGEQARHIAYIINQAKQRGAHCVQPTAEAEAEWVAEIKKHAANTLAFLESCTPGYYNNEGKADLEAGRFGGDAYAPGANAFNALLAEWRDKGDLAGLELSS